MMYRFPLPAQVIHTPLHGWAYLESKSLAAKGGRFGLAEFMAFFFFFLGGVYNEGTDV